MSEMKSELPAGLPQPAVRALTGAGYQRLEQFTSARPSELSKLHGVGPKAIRIIRSALAESGLSFADE